MGSTVVSFGGLWCFWRSGGPGFGAVSGFLGLGGDVDGAFAVGGAGRVESFESPPLMRKDSGQPPLMNSPENGALGVCRRTGGGPPVDLEIAETLICKVLRGRVSLESCSGAILDRWVRVVPGVSVV